MQVRSSDKIEAIKCFLIPCKIKQLRSFLGIFGYYHKFIRNCTLIAKPLYDLTKKDVPFQWSETCYKAFNELKDEMLSADVSGFPNFKRSIVLATDASTTGLGACLSQEIDSVLKPVGFAGLRLNWHREKLHNHRARVFSSSMDLTTFQGLSRRSGV